MAKKTWGLGGSETRLWKMIEERCQKGTDKAALDRRIFDLFGERWCVMFTDLSGFSRHVDEFGIVHFLQVIHQHHKIVLPIVEAYDGLLVKVEGDSLLILFRRPERAIECALAMQLGCEAHSAALPAEEKVLLCVGIGYGEVLRIGDSEVWGREVNAASKLGEDTAKTGEILVTLAAKEGAETASSFEYEDVGFRFSEAERVFRLVR